MFEPPGRELIEWNGSQYSTLETHEVCGTLLCRLVCPYLFTHMLLSIYLPISICTATINARLNVKGTPGARVISLGPFYTANVRLY